MIEIKNIYKEFVKPLQIKLRNVVMIENEIDRFLEIQTLNNIKNDIGNLMMVEIVFENSMLRKVIADIKMDILRIFIFNNIMLRDRAITLEKTESI